MHGIFLDSIARTLLISPTFKALIDDQEILEKVYIQLDDKFPLGAYQRSIISIGSAHINNEGMNPEAFIYIAAHEFRHAWQDAIFVLSKQLELSASDLTSFYRIIEADAVAFQTTVCYELAEAGINGPLNHLLHSNYGSCAEAFLKKIEKNPSTAQTGTAQRAAYLSYLENRPFSRNYALSACDNYSCYRIADNLRFSFRPVASLMDVDKQLSVMPFYDEDGRLTKRPSYDIKPKTQREIDLIANLPGADLILRVKHLDRHPPARPIRS